MRARGVVLVALALVLLLPPTTGAGRAGGGLAAGVAAAATAGPPLLGPTPTPTPSVPLLGPTPAPGQATPAAALPGVLGTSYVSPTYGYRLTWDTTWTVHAATSQGGTDLLQLTDGPSAVQFLALIGWNGDAGQCLQTEVARFFNSRTARAVAPGADAAGHPLQASAAGHAWAVYTYQYTPARGSPQARAAYFDCWTLVPGRAILLFVQDVGLDAYNAEAPRIHALLARLVLPAAPGQTTAPAAATRAVAPTPVPTSVPAASTAGATAGCTGVATWYAATKGRVDQVDAILNQLVYIVVNPGLEDATTLLEDGGTISAFAVQQRAGVTPPIASKANTDLANALDQLGATLTAVGSKLNAFDPSYRTEQGEIPAKKQAYITAKVEAQVVARQCGVPV